MSGLVRIVLLCLTLLAAGSAAMAQAPEAPAPADAGVTVGKAVAITGACLAAALAAVGGGWSISRIGSACVESIARQPEAAGSVFAPMVITSAMVEGGMLFAVLVCLLVAYRI